jgi:hypothetical protein
MFPRVLFVAERSALELDWCGYGALQVRHDTGSAVPADPAQTAFFRESLDCLSALAAADVAAHRELFRSTLDLLQFPPSSLAWRGALYEGPEEFAKLALENARFSSRATGMGKPSQMQGRVSPRSAAA